MSNINYYNVLPKQYKGSGTKRYKNYNRIKIDIPMRCLIIGASGSGKTLALMNMINSINAWDRVYLCCPNIEQPLYKFLRDTLGKSMVAVESFDELPNLDEYNPKESSLVIFDDMLNADNKTMKKIGTYFIRGRHKGISPVFITQSYYATPSIVRRNSDIIIMRKLQTVKDLKNIVKEYSLDKPVDEVLDMYNTIRKGPIEDWFMIDMATNDPELRYRKNWSPFNDRNEAQTANGEM